MVFQATSAAGDVTWNAPDDIRWSRPIVVDLQVTTNFYEGDEDESALPFQTDIYLMPESIIKILGKKRFAPEDENGQPLADEQSFLDAIAHTFGAADDESRLLDFLIRTSLDEKKIIKLMTDASGRGKARIKSGVYYLFTFKEADGEVFIWHFPIDLVIGGKTVEIDQHNADAVAVIEK